MFTATFRGDKFLKIRAAYFGGPTFELFQQSKSDEATLTRRVVYACTSADRWASLMKDPVVARILVPFIVDTLNEQTFYCSGRAFLTLRRQRSGPAPAGTRRRKGPVPVHCVKSRLCV
jgi:hypothetical protein